MPIVESQTVRPLWVIDKTTKWKYINSYQIESTKYNLRPATVQRPLPVDLEANCTSRYTESTITDCNDDAILDTGTVLLVGPFRSFYSSAYPSTGCVYADRATYTDLDNKLLLKIKGQSANFLVSMYNYKKTANLFLSTAQTIAESFHKLRKGRPIAAFKRLLGDPRTPADKRIAAQWLQIQYAWGPTMMTVYGSAEQLSKHLLDHLPQRAEVRKTEMLYATYPGTYAANRDIVMSHKLVRKVSARWDVSSSGMKTLAEVGVVNPASLVWEVVPYSFVVNWFIPVGEWLSSLDALVGVQNLIVNRSAYSRTEVYETMKTHSYKIIRPATLKTIHTRTSRMKTGNTLNYTFRAGGGINSNKRLLNALALLRMLR